MRAIPMSLMFAVAVSFVVVSARQTVYEPGPGITLPSVIKEVKPDYPREAMDAGVQGDVVMACVVSRDGRPGEITIERSLEPRLDDAAVAALKQWEFKPGTKDGEPVAVRVRILMTFRVK
jgi:periplasmic protein TonB